MKDMEQRIATWVAMVKSIFCKAYTLSHSRFLELDEKYKLLHYLFENYELLHYHSNEAIIDSLVEYLGNQGGSVDELS